MKKLEARSEREAAPGGHLSTLKMKCLKCPCSTVGIAAGGGLHLDSAREHPEVFVTSPVSTM